MGGQHLKPRRETSHELPTEAANWVASNFDFTTSKIVTNHSWAKTYQLQNEKGEQTYLKILPKHATVPTQALMQIANKLQPHVPKFIAFEPHKGFYLYQDHNGTELDRVTDLDEKSEILTNYARIQSNAISMPELLDDLPRVLPSAQYDLFLELMDKVLNDNTDAEFSGNPFLYMRQSTVGKYRNIFHAAEPLIRAYLVQADLITPTLNHCDLRAKNIARRKDRSLCIFDWDDAAYGPPGLSLHSMFSGCFRIHKALGASATDQDTDRQVLDEYIDILSLDGHYTKDALIKAIPPVACAGVMRYIISFAKYPTKNKTSQKSISKNIRKRLSDMIDLACDLAVHDTTHADYLAETLEQNGRKERAQKIRPPKQQSQITKATPAITEPQDMSSPDVFPYIEISSKERNKGSISKDNKTHAADIFKEHGALMIKNAFSPELIKTCHQNFDALSEKHQDTINQGGALRVGNKRFMISLEFAEPYSDENLLASPFVMPILHTLLTKSAILGSLTAVASLPGSKDQSIHRDNPPLFEENSDLHLPNFCIALIVPLVPLNEVNGATRIIKGSHRLRTHEAKGMPSQNPIVDIGSCYMMDSRLFHQGMANNSDHTRPILSMVYQRPWYRDHKNFKNQSPMNISKEQVPKLSKPLSKLVGWAAEV